MTGKICIVEDTPDLLENLTQFPGLEGFDVLPCRNSREASKLPPSIDQEILKKINHGKCNPDSRCR